MASPNDSHRYQAPKLITYGKVEDLTQVKLPKDPGSGGGDNNKNPGALMGKNQRFHRHDCSRDLTQSYLHV